MTPFYVTKPQLSGLICISKAWITINSQWYNMFASDAKFKHDVHNVHDSYATSRGSPRMS